MRRCCVSLAFFCTKKIAFRSETLAYLRNISYLYKIGVWVFAKDETEKRYFTVSYSLFTAFFDLPFQSEKGYGRLLFPKASPLG
jgi:hypothetical protein